MTSQTAAAALIERAQTAGWYLVDRGSCRHLEHPDGVFRVELRARSFRLQRRVSWGSPRSWVDMHSRASYPLRFANADAVWDAIEGSRQAGVEIPWLHSMTSGAEANP